MTDLKVGKLLQDKLIEQFKLLTHPASASLLFSSVEKIYMSEPTQLPSCEVQIQTVNNTTSDNYTNNKIFVFDAIVYDLIESASNTQAEADSRVDRISNINDSLTNWLSYIPLPIEYSITDLHCWKVDEISSNFDRLQNSQGVMLYLSIKFSVYTTNEIR